MKKVCLVIISVVLTSMVSLSAEMKSMKSETQRDREVEETLIKTYSLKRGEDIVHYMYNKVDLNGDKKPEVIVYAYGPMLGGSGGDSGLILKEVSEGYQVISELSLVRTPIIISDNKTKGWNDIIMEVSGGGATPEQAVLKFNGKKYPSNPSTQPKLGKNAKIEGVQILADEFVPDIGIPLK